MIRVCCLPAKVLALGFIALGLAGCGLFGAEDEWIYAETPIPPDDERGGLPLVMVVGDSIAAGWSNCEDGCTGIENDWWATALEGLAIVRSRGVGNTTSSDLLQRWAQDTSDADIVVIMIGLNDIKFGVSAEELLGNLATMQRRATENGQQPIFTTVMPGQYTAEEVATWQTVNAAIRAEDWLLIDLAPVLEDVDKAGILRPDATAYENGIPVSHPDATGYEILATFVRDWWVENLDTINMAANH